MNTPLYKQVYDLLLKNNIKKENILYELNNVYKYIETIYFDYFEFEYTILYHIKDILWYNVEHLSNNKIEFGLTNLSTIGSKFKIINQLDNNVILNIDEIQQLKNELDYVKNNLNDNWKVAKLYSEYKNSWTKDDNVIIYNKSENPRKYNYYKKTNILDINNKNMYINKDVVLCEIDSKLGDSYIKNIIYNTILNLYNKCNSCIKENKFLIFKGVN